MPHPTEPSREHPNTYFVQDRSTEDEMTHLEIQDKMVTTGGNKPMDGKPMPIRGQQ